MPCYSPLQAWRGGIGESGKRSVVFRMPSRSDAESLTLPCGQCIGCRLERSRQWAMRCLHESSLYDKNCFITLTYDPDHLPKDGSIDVRDFQLFMKRLRKAYSDIRIRFFHCGEYGERLGRPHYHACVFGFDFPDKLLYSIRNGNNLYTSQSCTSIWGKGLAVIGDVTFESAAYVARYITKKITGEDAADHYGERRPEYITMSRRPGIGRGWYDKFRSDVYPHDYTVVRGVKVKPPKYYDGLYEVDNKVGMDIVKSDRILSAMDRNEVKFDSKGRCVSENESYRLKVKEAVKLSKLKSLVRPMEASNDY